MPDWLIAFVYVAATWGYQALAARQRGNRRMPPLAFFPLAGLLAGAAIGNWWAPALALAGLPTAFALNRGREGLRAREMALGMFVDASMIALGCVLSRVF